MKSEDTPFVGGPLDGRVLPILLGPTGHPPKFYRVPVPDPAGGPPTVLVYRRATGARSKRLGMHLAWKYEYVPEGVKGRGVRLKWPWSKPAPQPGQKPTPKPGTGPGNQEPGDHG